MAYPFRILESSQTEIDHIVQYLILASGSIRSAEVFLSDFEHHVALVCESPFLYRLSRIPELSERGYRAFLFGRYVALYFFEDETVFVAHVFHQRQDYATLV